MLRSNYALTAINKYSPFKKYNKNHLIQVRKWSFEEVRLHNAPKLEMKAQFELKAQFVHQCRIKSQRQSFG